ncbi:hypothetical protein [Pseudogulbenkiania ferrooxidans]|uniref:hypothetical protein n=1 Tax=Pseudogulbenkiania ferrooxidans TaxID=549169 RepID=UPI00191703C0|nr:hypothetical protein [Pseudogulbenkiania ferrooxidans]
MIMGSAVRRQKTGYAATGDKAGRRQKGGQRWPHHGNGAAAAAVRRRMLQSNKNGAAQMVTRPLPPRRPGYKKQALKEGTARPRVAANALDDLWALPARGMPSCRPIAMPR